MFFFIIPGFNEAAKMFAQKFVEGCCYKVSECEVISSSPSHSGISHKYQLRLNQFSEVTPATPFEPRFMPLLTPLSSLKKLNRMTDKVRDDFGSSYFST